MSGAQTAHSRPPQPRPPKAASFLDQVVAATKQTAPDQAQDLVKNLVEQALAGTVTFDKNLTRTFDRADRRDRSQAVRTAQRDHAPPEVPGARRHLARAALPGDEQRDQHQPEAARAEPAEARAVTRPAARGRVRPEPAVQEDLRERVRHAGRRAVRRADRRLRVDAASRTTSRRCAWCPTSPRRRSRRSSRPPAPACSASTAGPNSPSRAIWRRSSRRRNTPSGAASATARTRASSTW